MAAMVITARSNERKGDAHLGDVDLCEGSSCRELARAILKLGEVYERIEGAKQRMMVELEKQRMEAAKELELQRMNMLMDMQMELERFKSLSSIHSLDSQSLNYSLLIGFFCVKEEIRNDKEKRHKNLVCAVFTSLLQCGEGAILTGAGLSQQSTRTAPTRALDLSLQCCSHSPSVTALITQIVSSVNEEEEDTTTLS
ncbi:LOW QUALITY PROTEIN: hypothetical protein YC2023_012988 [Brassica napus]